MKIRILALAIVALPWLALPALAQDSGGLRLGAGVGTGPTGLAKPLPYVRPPFMTAQDMQNGMTSSDHQAKNQSMITALRGDPGFLSGFSMGTPLAASRQGQGQGQGYPNDYGWHRRHHGEQPIVINNEGPLAITNGNGNVVQLQSANGSGPIALQQAATAPGGGNGGAGALNLVTGSGNIVQRAPN